MKTTTRHATILAVATLMTALPAAAARQNFGPVPDIYRAQAQRCAAAIRDALPAVAGGEWRHAITVMEKRGSRRAFTFESIVTRSSDGSTQGFQARCLAERWGDGTELRWVRPRALY